MVDRMALCKERRRLLNQCVPASVKVKPSKKFGNNVDFPWTNGWPAGTIVSRDRRRRPRKDGTRNALSPQSTDHRVGWLVALDVAWEEGCATNIMFEVALVSVATCRAS
jgi:hypothetical protein